MQEENIISSLSQMKILLILDHVNGISAGSKSFTDLKIFLARFLDRCKNVKVSYIILISFQKLFEFSKKNS